MHIYYPHDPRVKVTGYWAARGRIKSYTNCEIAILRNFLSSFLVEWCEEIGNMTLLVNNFHIDNKSNLLYVSFQHTQNLLNFFDTMGWTYQIQGE